jgi:FKBP-type peptidyl-prolyl cis-trans isomerase
MKYNPIRPMFYAALVCAFAVIRAAGQNAAAQPAAASATPAPPAPAFPLSAFAAIGSSFAEGNHLPELGWSDAQIEAFIDGVRASFHGKGYAFDDDARRVSAEMGRRVQEIASRDMQQELAQPEQLKQYLKEVCKRLNLEQTDSGLCFGIQSAGKGNRPGPDDTVLISCVATAADGSTKLPQLSYEKKRVKVSSLLPGISEGIQMMTNTSQAIFVLPPALSFGTGEWPEGVAVGTPLIFQITLHEVVSAGSN